MEYLKAMAQVMEQANSRGRFTREDIEARIRESKDFWNSPQGDIAQRKFELRKLRAALIPSRFPELAKRDNRPAVGGIAEVEDWAARFGIPTR